MKRLGERVWEGCVPRPQESPARFVQRLIDAEHHPELGHVPASTYWAVIHEVVVGRIAMRHQLNEELAQFGGHIGYKVRPTSRRRGIGRAMLAQVLQTSKAKEIGRLLLTCAPDDVASNKIIAANGGVVARTAFVDTWQRQTNYYWIDLS